MAILMGNGACGSKRYAIDERRAEVPHGIYGRPLGEKLFTSDNLGSISRQ
jgi:hypothetical protein